MGGNELFARAKIPDPEFNWSANIGKSIILGKCILTVKE